VHRPSRRVSRCGRVPRSHVSGRESYSV
jgi:hypothetical protein